MLRVFAFRSPFFIIYSQLGSVGRVLCDNSTVDRRVVWIYTGFYMHHAPFTQDSTHRPPRPNSELPPRPPSTK